MTRLEVQRFNLVENANQKGYAKSALDCLNIPMSKRDLTLKGLKTPLERFQAVVREDNGKVLSIVSPGYKLVGHGDSLRGFLLGLEQAGWDFTRVSLERDGAHAFVEATNRKIVLVEDDKGPTFIRMTLWNSVDLRSSLKGMFGAYRQVCTNSMVLPDKRFSNLTFRAVHVGPAMEKFGEFANQLKTMIDYVKTLAPVYRSMMNQRVSDKTAELVLSKVVGKRQIDRLLGLWDSAPGQPEQTRTQWGLYQAVTWWLTHEASGGVYYRDLRSLKALNTILYGAKRSQQN